MAGACIPVSTAPPIHVSSIQHALKHSDVQILYIYIYIYIYMHTIQNNLRWWQTLLDGVFMHDFGVVGTIY